MKKLTIISFNLILLICSKAYCADDVFVKGVANPIISLNGNWEICLDPPVESQYFTKQNLIWKNILVPGECMMQGFKIQHDKPFLYKKEVLIPSDYKGKKIRLRFEGVYSYARLWVNGKYIRDHSGGFTAWEADITNVGTPGKTAIITVEVTDKKDEISYASGYAKHPIGGMLRNVSLLAVPISYPENISITTDLDQNYKDAILNVQGNLTKASSNFRIELELYDVSNQKMPLSNKSITPSDTLFQLSNKIFNPLKWDAEHPNLYQLKVFCIENGKTSWYKNYFFGFRKIEVQGNRFLVNGTQIKLRGACHHDIHPSLGRVSTPEYDLKDVLLAKEANINFIRTSHYPPTDNFLQLCDKYGIYVEDETAVCFVNSYRSPEYAPGSTENSSGYTEKYLSRLKEMVENHRNHPSVIIWSIGNENKFGLNFQKSFEWVKKTDPTRPVIFSFPGTVKDANLPYDILSMHYPNIDGSLEQYGIKVKSFGNASMPVLFDEWAHVPCYNNSTIKEDPNVRDFWGRSLDSMWMKTYDADGALGGAIWGMIDETFMLPDTTVGYGEWGIVDTWRRKKPEFWNVKKAYSPVRIDIPKIANYQSNSVIELPVYNRFDFTDLSELTVLYSVKGIQHSIYAPSIPPHSKGFISIPIKEWPINEPILIDFINKNKELVDRYAVHRNLDHNSSTGLKPVGEIKLSEDEHQYSIQCSNNLKFRIDKGSGLISQTEAAGSTTILSGPYINFRTKGKGNQTSSNQFKDYGVDWQVKSLIVNKKVNAVEVLITGDYLGMKDVKFRLQIYSDESISTEYTISNPTKEYIREAGVKFILSDQFDSLTWERYGYWNCYPPDHLSAPKGKVSIYSDKQTVYRKAPVIEWQFDTKSFYYDGINKDTVRQLTYIAKSTKENIREYVLSKSNGEKISINGTGKEACRIQKNGHSIELFINNLWDYPDLAWGNYQKNILPGKEISGQCQISINPK